MRKVKGFTLIELLVAIALIGVLSSVLVVVIDPLGQIKKGRDTQRKTDLFQIQKPLELYYNDHGFYPPSITFGVEWKEQDALYMAKVPQDPLSPQQEYVYQSVDNQTGYRLYAKLEGGLNTQDIAETDCGGGKLCNYSVASSNAP